MSTCLGTPTFQPACPSLKFFLLLLRCNFRKVPLTSAIWFFYQHWLWPCLGVHKDRGLGIVSPVTGTQQRIWRRPGSCPLGGLRFSSSPDPTFTFCTRSTRPAWLLFSTLLRACPSLCQVMLGGGMPRASHRSSRWAPGVRDSSEVWPDPSMWGGSARCPPWVSFYFSPPLPSRGS